jgi:YHS domain-containing protein
MFDLKNLHGRKGFFTAIICCALGFVPAALQAKSDYVFSPNPSNHVINDVATGLAIFGYDPVAYHTDKKAREGKAEFDVVHHNLSWRFTSQANREAFLADPSAYIPAFGGHDAMSVRQGRMAMGDPSHFILSQGTVILFRSAENRDQFAADPDSLKAATERWPVVVRQHASH